MTVRKRKFLCSAAVALSGSALLVGAALAQPAAAVELPWGKANFYTGRDLTGTVLPVKATDTECTKLPEPALSVANFAFADVLAYADENCTDIVANVPGLHWGNLYAPAVSYRVIPTYSPASTG
ncbi:hypothetical protein ACWDSD_35225 [Streptomyces spiralis]